MLWGVASFHKACYLRWAISLVVGFGGAVSYANHFLDVWAKSPMGQILVLLYLTILFSLIAYGLLFRVAWPRLAPFSLRARTAWGLVSLLTGGMLMVVLPVHVPLSPSRHSLEIVATGDKNPLAKASQVWVVVRRPDGSKAPISELELVGDWEVRDGVPVSLQNQPASLKWEGVLNGDLTVVFVSHPWSGMVEVRWGGHQQRLDLYSNIPTQQTVTLPETGPGQRQTRRTLLAIGLYGASIVSLGVLGFIVSVWLATRPSRLIAQVTVSRWAWLHYALPCALVWTMWLLAFWPGIMNPDSVDQWGQMLSGNLNDWHPAIHTLTNWLITRLWLSPAAVALTQIVALSAVVGWGLVRMRQLGVPAIAVWICCAVFALSPANSTMVINLCKDTPYSIALLALTLLVLEVVISDGAWLERRTRWGLLGGVAALVALYRHNGPVSGFGTLVVLALIYRRHWRPLVAALVLALGLWLGVRGPLYNMVGVGKSRWVGLQPLIHQVAAHVAAGTTLEDGERAFLNAICPLGDGWRYSCYSINPTLYDGQFRSKVIEANPGRFLRIWWALVVRDPRIVLKHLVCSSSLIWRITQPLEGSFWATALWISGEYGITTIDPTGGYANELDLHPQSLLPGLALPLATWVTHSQAPDASWLIWRPALYLYFALGSTAVMSLRSKCWKYLSVVLPTVLHSLAMMFLTLVAEFRFQYPVYLVGLLMIGGFFCCGVSSERRV